MIQTGRVDQTLGVHLNKIYKTQAGESVDSVSRRDEVNISKFSALVEHGRSVALSLCDVRADKVAQARNAIANGELPGITDIAASMINSAVKGQV